MANFLLLTELSFTADSSLLSDMMRLCFEREVDEEKDWQAILGRVVYMPAST